MPKSKMPAESPSDNLLEFAITEAFGEPCVTADADCYTCQAWAQYNRLRYRADLVEPLVEALRAAIRVAEEAREEWDKAPSGMKAGKLLIALSEPSLKYRADITAIHAALSSWEAGQ